MDGTVMLDPTQYEGLLGYITEMTSYFQQIGYLVSGTAAFVIFVIIAIMFWLVIFREG